MHPSQSTFHFSFHPRQRERFRNGSLVQEWRQRYPMLFDDDDVRILSTEHQRRYHFFEWLAAILLFEATGYVSLVEKYTAKSHASKRQAVQELLPPALFEWLSTNESGQPDLFVFHPTTQDWFFCEVKGGEDRIRDNQIKWMQCFAKILASDGIKHERRVRLLCFQAVDT